MGRVHIGLGNDFRPQPVPIGAGHIDSECQDNLTGPTLCVPWSKLGLYSSQAEAAEATTSGGMGHTSFRCHAIAETFAPALSPASAGRLAVGRRPSSGGTPTGCRGRSRISRQPRHGYTSPMLTAHVSAKRFSEKSGTVSLEIRLNGLDVA